MQKTQNNAFTLIELIVVISILGILTLVVLAKYADFKTDARRASLSAVESSIHSMSNLVHLKAGVEQVDNGTININGRNISLFNGYPEAHWNRAFRYLLELSAASGFTRPNTRCSGFAFCGVGNRRSIPGIGALASGRAVMVWPEGYLLNELCFVYYVNPENGDPPTIGHTFDGC